MRLLVSLTDSASLDGTQYIRNRAMTIAKRERAHIGPSPALEEQGAEPNRSWIWEVRGRVRLQE
jgi:hypothetical protein